MLDQFPVAPVLTAGFGAAAFLLAYRLVTYGVNLYEEQFVSRVSAGLQASFLVINARHLFFINLAAMALFGFLGYLVLGLMGMLCAVIILAALPGLVLHIIRRRRAREFVYQMPDCFSAMASSLRAGTSLPRAMAQIAAQYPAPASQEFAIVLSEYRLGRSFEESLQDVYLRIPTPEVELLSSAVSISRSVGGNLADTLDTLAETVREQLRVEGKIGSLTAMARMQGWVVALLPVLVGYAVYRQEPGPMSALVLEPVGWVTLGVLILMMLAAAWLIRRIVNIDI